jgi:hypothetical protein
MGLSVSALPVPADVGAPVTQTGLGAAAERYARLTLRKSAQTQATYMSTYRRFAAWLAEQSGHPDPPPAALTADVVADYITELERKRAPATVKKERAAINRLTKYLHTVGAIDATEILMIEGSRGGAQPGGERRWTRPPGAASRTWAAPGCTRARAGALLPRPLIAIWRWSCIAYAIETKTRTFDVEHVARLRQIAHGCGPVGGAGVQRARFRSYASSTPASSSASKPGCSCRRTDWS